MSEQRSFYIAGVKFHQLATVINNIKVGNSLKLSPEPTNKFDPNAVRIEYMKLFQSDKGYDEKGVMLGYVPKKFSSEICAMLEAGLDLECVILEVNTAAKPWEQCRVVIKAMEEEVSE